MQKTDFDNKIRPQDDFYGYVNNNWLQNNPIPPSETRWGNFDVLRDNSWRAVHEIVDELIELDDTSLTSDQKTLQKFFQSALSFNNHSKNHIETLKHERDIIEKISTKSELALVIGRLHRIGLAPFFTEYAELDDKDSNLQVLRLHQAGLSLPNRDYYLEDDERMTKIRKDYQKHLKEVAIKLPQLTPTETDTIIQLETKLAEISWTDVELRDVERNYTRMTIAELEKRYQHFNWASYFDGLGWKSPSDHLVVDQSTYFDSLQNILQNTPLKTIKQYLIWHLLNGFISWIDQDSSNLNFNFYGQKLGGMKEQKPLWKRVTMLADSMVIGEALGREYAARHFPESSKIAVTELVEQIRDAYHARIDRLDWMKPETKKRAHEKLSKIGVFVGYPSKWKDISGLNFVADNLISNIIQTRNLAADIEIAKIGQAKPSEEWFMNAQTVNAYNHPSRLEIVFPAAILQPPFYDPNASLAANLGGIGAVIGHEFTHGFDDQGSHYDESGNTNQWISDTELEEFNKLADIIVRQADEFETLPGVFLQGKLILGEAIADIGGLALAVEAFKRNTNPEEFQAGLAELFANFAICECGATTPERAVELAKTDPHPPSVFRVNCVVCHVDEFYTAYNLTKSDKLFLNQKNRAKIW